MNAKTSSGALECESLELRGFTWAYEGARGVEVGGMSGGISGRAIERPLQWARWARPGLSTGGGDRGEEALCGLMKKGLPLSSSGYSDYFPKPTLTFCCCA